MNIQDKLQSMKDTYRSEDQPTIASWETQLEQLLLREGIAGSDSVQLLITEMTGEIEKMNMALQNSLSSQLPDYQRDRMIDKREMYERFLKYFDVKKQLKDLETEINNQ